ncbi:hypothetical protein GT037_002596 [Alternaria burnsii]|uniref:Uncharacterized protein n=1 Tax=Alternaria burnsii TaxID=1187904 RepID=A0A8H7EHH1_9PLEO|nr:uncharacterized protein GT037_002596 [Alternaria burnsii]KAF7678848.1 hypothetical protein GT037_002596 [Alternaria burnsii]
MARRPLPSACAARTRRTGVLSALSKLVFLSCYDTRQWRGRRVVGGLRTTRLEECCHWYKGKLWEEEEDTQR